MTARELIEILEDLNPETEVYFLPSNSCYPEDFSDGQPEKRNIRSFWGEDFTGAIIHSDGQIGGVQ